MRILLISLMLLVGVNQMLARTLFWYTNNYDLNGNVYDEDYDPFRINGNHFMSDESSEKSEEERFKPFTNNNDDETALDDVFGNFMASILPMHEENVNSDEKLATGSSGVYTIGKNNYGNDDDDDDDDDEKPKKTDVDKNNNNFIIQFSDIFGSEEQKSSEERTDVTEEIEMEASRSSEETFKEDANEEEVSASQDRDVEKSSEENKSDSDVNISERDIKDLTYFLMTLNILDGLAKVTLENQNPDYANDESLSNELKTKEVDQYLELLSEALEKVKEDEWDAKKETKNDNEKDEDDDNNNFTFKQKESNEDDSSEENKTTTMEYESDEDDHNTATTAIIDSDEINEDNNDNNDDENNSSNASDSNENDSNPTFFVFHGIDNDNEHHDLNDDKYELVGSSSPEFHPTSAPFHSELIPSSRSEDLNAVGQYFKMRANIDEQQATLHTNERAMDKDFYSLISNNYDEEGMKKFENDIYMVHDDLDRIKRNINAMQTFHSKLYLHKLITAAVQNAQSKLKN